MVQEALAQLLGDASRWVLPVGLIWVHAFSLVAVRLSGLMLIGPLFGQAVIPVSIRVLLIIALSFLLTPIVPSHLADGFASYDVDRSGTLDPDELPDGLHDRLADRTAPTDEVTRLDFDIPPHLPKTALDYLLEIAAELLIGFSLGLGIQVLFSGFELAGEMIDQQIGTSLGGVFNPGLDLSSGMTGRFLYMLATTILLLMEPVGGHLLVMDALLSTFARLPIGSAFVSVTAMEMIIALMQQSFILSVQVVAPFLAVMSLVSVMIGFLNYTVPTINVISIGFTVRAALNIMVLALALSGVAHQVAEKIPTLLETWSAAWTEPVGNG